MKKYFKIINTVIFVLLICALSFFIDGIIEKNKTNKKIEEFKSRAELIYENDIYTYYKVSKKHQYEDTSNIVKNYDDINVGTTGDIYLTNRNPINGFFVTSLISKMSYIGHGAMIYDEKGKEIVEIVGNKSWEENEVKIVENKWLTIDSPNYIILRSKNIDSKRKEVLKEESNNILGSKYNYTFISNKKTFYCTDMISYLYKKINIKLNKDFFFTTGSDIITNNEMYIIYFRERYIKNNKVCYNVYYLSEE